MLLSSSFKRRHSCPRIPFPIFPAQWSPYSRLISAPAPSMNRTEFVSTHTTFSSFFPDGTVCGEMTQWIPVILLSHCQAAGSHAGKLSIQPKSGKGFQHRHLFRCVTECRKSLTNTYRQEHKHSPSVSVISTSHFIGEDFYCFTLVIFIPLFYYPLSMRSFWYTQMDQPDGFLLTQWNSKTLNQNDSVMSPILFFLRPDGNISSSVHWWEKNICRTYWRLKTKQNGS